MSDVIGEEHNQSKDPTRLCPDCRMPISILAVRCRFCGAEVGRPRKEQETFTVADLGGEQKSSYVLSGNVTEALEAFMMEERSQIEDREREKAAARKTLFQRTRAPQASGPDPAARNASGLPELDPMRRDLAGIGMSSSRSGSIKVKQGGDWDKYIKISGVIVVAALLLGGAVMAWPRIRVMLSGPPQTDAFVYPNRAEDMIAAGAPLVEALEEALAALQHNNTSENQAIAERVRKKFIEDVNTRIFAAPFNMDVLSAASNEVARASQKDAHADTIALLDTVNREVGYFKFILTRMDADAGNAVFRLNNPFMTEREQTVAVGDLLQDRFLVTDISSRGVRLEDTHPQCGKRRLIARSMVTVAAD